MTDDKIAEIDMRDDITQKLRVTMPDFKGLEISCPCRIRSLLMKDAADEIEKLTRERDEARAEVERLRAENARLRAQIAEYFTEPATHPVEET